MITTPETVVCIISTIGAARMRLKPANRPAEPGTELLVRVHDGA